MLNLDPALLDQDKIRLKKRRRLLIWAIAPLALLLLAAIFFIKTNVYNLVLNISIAGETYGPASVVTNMQMFGNLIESHISYYNNGYLRLIQANNRDDLKSAENDFNESLKHNPPESQLCAVYGNLSYSIELQGDLSFNDKNYNEALVLYNRAESLLFENDCVSRKGDNSGKDQKSEAARKRIEEKRHKAIDAANNRTDPNSGDDGDSNNGGQELTDEQLREIMRQQQEVINNNAGNPYNNHNGTPGGGISNFRDPNF